MFLLYTEEKNHLTDGTSNIDLYDKPDCVREMTGKLTEFIKM